MAQNYPVVTIQCDWNDALRLPNSEAWISTKNLHEKSTHGKIKSTINSADDKIKINTTDEFQYISHTNMCLVVKHLLSNLKVAFIAPTKAHKVHSKGALSVSAAENALAVSSCEGNRLLVWDSRTSEVLLNLEGHGGPVYKARFFPSGIVILSAGADGSCRIWSAESGINPVTLKGHQMAISDVCIVEKGRNVISVSKDGTAKLWDVGESNCLADLVQGNGPINCCCITNTLSEHPVANEREIGTSNKLLAVGCESGLVICGHVARREEVFRVQLQSPCHACVALEDSVVVGCENGEINQISLQNGSIIKRIHESASPVLSLALLANQCLIIGRQDGTCTILSMLEQHQGLRVSLTGSDCDGIRDIACNGKWVFTACRDGLIRKYDVNQIAVHFK